MRTTQVATIRPRSDKPDPNNAYNHASEKEEVRRLVLVVLDPEKSELHEVCDARFYMGRSPSSSVVTCSLWIVTRDTRHLGGQGRASGGGYCKQSAAFDEACTSAGIKLAANVNGAGMSAVEEAMHAIADAAGYSECRVRVMV